MLFRRSGHRQTVASPASSVFTVEEPGLGVGLCNVKLPGGTWLSPSVHILSLPYSCALAIVTASGPFTPAQLATALTPSSCFHSVCQEFPCGRCNEDICAAQLGGP